MNETISKIEELNRELKHKVTTTRKEIHEKQNLEMENARKLKELHSLQMESSLTEENQDALSSRNTVMREKFNLIDENVKIEGEEVAMTMKSFFKKLGLKVSLATHPDGIEQLFELKMEFTENREYNATFYYDTITEDYDSKYNAYIGRF
jgi:uncharacterized protein YydD (DUF2326 family)